MCLREGAQLTKLRRSVLSLILAAQKPPTAYQLLDQLSADRGKGAAPITIYRALDFLVGKKLIHKIERLNAFVSCVEPEPHTHPVEFLICRECGSVKEVEDEGVSKALAKALKKHGFRAGRVTVEIEGLCAACLRKPQGNG